MEADHAASKSSTAGGAAITHSFPGPHGDPVAFGKFDQGSSNSGGSATALPPQRQRRRRILERNRLAATKCRIRKRDEASALATREQEMEDHNRYLASVYDGLAAEIYELKTQLLRHTECGCVLIQRYIANEAKRSVDNLASGNPSGSIDYSAAASRSSSISAPPLAGFAEACHNHHSHLVPTTPSIPLPPAMMEPTTPDELMCPTASQGSVDSATLQSPAESDGIQTPWSATPAVFPLGPPLSSCAPMHQAVPDVVLNASEGMYDMASIGIATGSDVHPMVSGIFPATTPGGLTSGCGTGMFISDLSLSQHVPTPETGWMSGWNYQ
jgi:hypothetical protein